MILLLVIVAVLLLVGAAAWLERKERRHPTTLPFVRRKRLRRWDGTQWTEFRERGHERDV